MTGPDPELEALLAPLREGPVSLSGLGTTRSRRARLLPALHEAVRAVPRVQARRRLLRRIRTATLGATALAAAVWLGSSALLRAPGALPEAQAAQARVQVQSRGEQPLAWLADGANERAIAGSDELHSAGELRASEGARAALVTQAGVRVELLPRSRLRMLSERAARGTETLSLLEGEVECNVPPLAKGKSFVVATPKARVVVHGTEFRVRVGGAKGSCVSVREGLVEVQSEGESVWLGPGSDWGCDEGDPSTQTKSKTVDSARRFRVRPHGKLVGQAEPESDEPVLDVPEPAQTGTLAVETQLLADALRAERQGQSERARGLFTRLVADYPASPLVPEARAGLARVR